MHVPPLETDRLRIRPFTMNDLDAAHQLLDVEVPIAGEGHLEREERRRWLEWTLLSDKWLPWLDQPPYGDRAIVLKRTDQVIGACGFVPCFAPFGQLPAFGSRGKSPTGLSSTEFGLYWAVLPAHQRQGYATEAGGALIDYAFRELDLERIVAMTTYGNAPSIAVMRKLGMQIERNPHPEPPWLQVVGVLMHPG